MQNIQFKKLVISNVKEIIPFGKLLNPNKSNEEIESSLSEMFSFGNYHCFGLYQDGKLVGISGGWITVRIYSGKQLEIDHFVIDDTIRSSGLGKMLLAHIENWSIANHCKTIELNAYVQSDRAHKFYFQNGYKVLGFHFQKKI
ncbi:GNAT family N-acetyltransferase [Flavobacterium sp.]|jgi:GNAT superfamily N-acetyltransferase|uniref:GNAT family N-acetyltransferase n=1 Tax=Flavobacterium sp. TaxID=239 RepID=UPI002A814391|nr:GNAT family N-acetyltransferase [Flavobacterium sp.]